MEMVSVGAEEEGVLEDILKPFEDHHCVRVLKGVQGQHSFEEPRVDPLILQSLLKI